MSEYRDELRAEVCSRCVERPGGGPPCEPLGKRCAIELYLGELVSEAHAIRSEAIDPYLDTLHRQTCAACENRDTDHCPCPLDYLHVLAIHAIDEVDYRRGQHPAAAAN